MNSYPEFVYWCCRLGCFAGMILFLPFASLLIVVCEEFEEHKAIALIIGEKIVKRVLALNNFYFGGGKNKK